MGDLEAAEAVESQLESLQEALSLAEVPDIEIALPDSA